MFRQLCEDYWLHGRDVFDRALWAMALYRFGQWADGCRVTPLRKLAGKVYGLLFRFSPFVTGVFLDRRTRIGKKFHLVHPGMIVIHPDAVFGDRCGIMHGVTVGVNMQGGVPRIGNDVFIGCHATVLGEITIGDGVRIAANSLVISDVPAGALAMGVPARIYPNMGKCPDPPTGEQQARGASGAPPQTAGVQRAPAASSDESPSAGQTRSAGQSRSRMFTGAAPSVANAPA